MISLRVAHSTPCIPSSHRRRGADNAIGGIGCGWDGSVDGLVVAGALVCGWAILRLVGGERQYRQMLFDAEQAEAAKEAPTAQELPPSTEKPLRGHPAAKSSVAPRAGSFR